MAFGRDDVDTVYEQALKPCIEAIGFEPRVVNRINHNDDIDDKIIAEIDSCDLCVADLTYTRPSVYYEAGYARAKGVPVVHTVRTDHLNQRKAKDNLRVHFDLQMKNIVSWQLTTLDSFQEKLTSRLELVSEPVLARLDKDLMRGEERAAFFEVSAEVKVRHLRTMISGHLESQGYKPGTWLFGDGHKKEIYGIEHYIQTSSVLEVRTENILSDYDRWNVSPLLIPSRHIITKLVICTNKLDVTSLAAQLATFSPTRDIKKFMSVQNEYVTDLKPFFAAEKDKDKPVISPRNIHEIAFIDAPLSVSDALESVDKILASSIDEIERFLIRD